jgi:hypothetical protein
MSIGGIEFKSNLDDIKSIGSDNGKNKIDNQNPKDTGKVADKISLSEIGGGSIKVSDPVGFEVTQEKHSVLESIAERMDSDGDGYTDEIDPTAKGNG